MAKPIGNILERLLANVSPEPNSGCWLWLGKTDKGGYARLAIKSAHGPFIARLAHRISYTLLVSPIPEGPDLDHLCRVHCCVNPAHLEPVTRSINLKRGIGVGDAGRVAATAHYKAITHCPQGHEYTEENTYCRPKAPGQRYCRACLKIRQAIRRGHIIRPR